MPMLQTNQTAPPPTAIPASYPLHRFVRIVSTTSFASGETRKTILAGPLATQTAPSPDAMSLGNTSGIGIVRSTSRVLGLIRERVESSKFATQTAPPPKSAGPGRFPTATSVTTLFVFGSMTATEFGRRSEERRVG